MSIEIKENISLNIYGFPGTAVNKDYVGTVFKLMDRLWQTVRSNGLKNKGLNIWVYDPEDKVFAGIELDDTPDPGAGLEQKNITLAKYAYYKHIGPYNLIKQAGENMSAELKNQGFEISHPYIEIYGHWTEDENKLETELLMCLK